MDNKVYLMKDIKRNNERTGVMTIVDTITPMNIADAFNEVLGLSGEAELNGEHIYFEGDTVVAMKNIPSGVKCIMNGDLMIAAKLYELQRVYVTEERTIKITKPVEAEKGE